MKVKDIKNMTLREFLESDYTIRRINDNLDPELLIDEWNWARDPDNPFNQIGVIDEH